ncbi:MAG: hypothetical protein C9356_15620 [Oleiphilus sp.]|nr:MAG: hypothetical protein C9356_15620 [Oleiphilus sp.]
MRQQSELCSIPIDLIHRGRYQPRRNFDPVALESMADSILEVGLTTPIAVFEVDGGYELISGERRWRACQIAGLTKIDAVVRSKVEDQVLALVSLIDNTQVEALDLFEQAAHFKKLSDEFGYRHEHIAKLCSGTGRKIGREWVTNLIRMLDLENEIRDLILDDDEWLKPSHGRTLLSLKGDARLHHARLCNRHRWSVQTLEKKVGEFKKLFASKNSKRSRVEDLSRLSEEISEYLCTPCEVSFCAKSMKGEIRVKFYDLDAVQGVLEKMGHVSS